jgi:protease-4
VLGLLVRLAWLLAWLIGSPLFLARRLAGRVPRGAYLLVEIDGAVEEAPAPPRPWVPVLPRPARAFSLHAFAGLVEEAARDRRVRGFLVVLKSMRGGFAAAASLRAVARRASAAGKEVVIHLPHGGATREAYAAAAADRAFLGPQAVLAPVGVLSSARYVRGALDRAGVVPEVHAHGRFKTAAERLERSAMSDAQREQVEAILDGVHRDVLSAIAVGRRVDEARARAIVDGAPYAGQEAVDAGLVDDVAHDDEVAARLASGGRPPAIRSADAYLRARRALRPRALRARGLLAVLRVHGPIVGEGAGVLPLARVAQEERVIAAVRLARTSPIVRGVVLHVDSPGGSALASARIHRELVLLAGEKPLVACMGDVAASGGYYVAAAAHEIVAQPVTITGSIGVIAARLLFDPLLDRLGVATQVLLRGARARLLDPTLPLGDDEKGAIDREIEHTYRAFLRVVADGRRRPVEEIEPLAQGRVWSGADAHARGLVDRLGGFEDALDSLRRRVGRGADRMRVVGLRGPRRSHPMPSSPQRKTAEVFASAVASAVTRAEAALGVDLSPLAFGEERVLAWCPVATSIRG